MATTTTTAASTGVIRKTSPTAVEAQERYQCYPLLPTLYGLNKSYTKKIMVALENSYHGDENFDPIIRISGVDGIGMKFTVPAWEELKNNFNVIDDYFNLRDAPEAIVTCSNFDIKLVISYHEKAMEISEKDTNDNSTEPPRKKYKRSLVFKRPTFEFLMNVAKCIDVRIEWLTMVKEAVKYTIEGVCDYVLDKIQSEHEAQIQYVSANDVQKNTEVYADGTVEQIVKMLKDEHNIILSMDESRILMYELSRLHLFNLCNVINCGLRKVNKSN